MQKYITHSSKETKAIGKKLAKEIKSGVIALFGDLGSGKTTFTQGFAEGLGIKDKIISPTFVLIRQHKIPNSQKILYHVDLYRLDNVDTKLLGLDDLFEDKSAIILIEWADKLEKLPDDTVKINFKTVDENLREITL